MKKSTEPKSFSHFLNGVQVLQIIQTLDIYASEKARLQKIGTSIHEFDLLIAATSIAYSLIMVTNNTSHFNKIEKIILEDWTA